MKALYALTALTFAFSANAHAKKLICTTSANLYWTKAEVETFGSNEITFKVLEGKGDIGKSADLFYTETVRPHGQTFYHYHGKFEDGASTKTLSVYLSEDDTTLTQMITGEPYNWSCK